MIPIPAPGRSMIVPVFLLLMLCSAGSHALDVRGVIDADRVWTAAESPVHITGDILVAEGATLTIEPGVQVVFQPRPDTARGYTLTVEGTLVARGEEGRPIVFTASDPNTPWGAILFEDRSEDWDEVRESGSVISGCVVEYGGNDPDGGEAMIFTLNAMPLIAGNAVRFSKAGGIAAFVTEDAVSLSGNLQIINNQVYGNVTGLVLSAEGGRVEGNYFLNNGKAVDILTRSNIVELQGNTVAGSSGELLGSAVSLRLNEPANGITAYHWEQTAGTPVVLDNPDSPRASFVAPDPGVGVDTLRFNLTVTGPSGSSTDSVTLSVIGLNQPPTAAAGGDINVQLPEEPGAEVRITLNGSGSHDPYIGIAGYRWEQVSGAAVSLETPNAAETEFVMPASVRAGDRMTFRLTVTDQLGLASADEVDIIFYDENIYPVAVAGDDFKTLQGQIVSLDGSGSRDADGGIAAYLWEQTGGTPVELFNFFTARPLFIAPAVEGSGETLSFRLRVLDTGGLQDADEISVQVKGATVSLPGDDRTVSAREPVTLDGRGSFDQQTSADVRIEGNRFTSGNAKAGLVAVTAVENARCRLKISGNDIYFTEAPGYGAYLFEWSETTAGIDMMDNWWGTDDPAVIEGMVFDQADDFTLPTVMYEPFAARAIPGAGSELNYPPLADAGKDIEKVSVDRDVPLDGSKSYDPDGIALYQWRQTEGTPVTLRDANAPVAAFVAPPGGSEGRSLRFSLTVTTGGRFSHTDEVVVTVQPDEPVPLVEAGGGCFIQTATSQGTMDNIMEAIMIMLLAGLGLGLLFLRKRCASFPAAVLTATLIFAAGPAEAGFFAVGGGAGGDADQYNITLESGAKNIGAGNLDLMFAVGVPFIPHGDDNLPDPTIASPCPNNDCRDAGDERKGTEVGFYGKLGVELGASNFYLNAIAGFTVYTESTLSRSEASGAYYEESSDTTIDPLYGIGVSYFAENFQWPVVLQLDVDVIRGVTGTIGWYW
ncbi:hypothetical protein [Desulfococcus sp.]|uniref:PKD domain-containing protein n=1 Tax=Desulfococcus sp. TaxID=2025834 RepID=UPI0035946668